MTLRAYRRFDEPGGDNCYLSDITDYRVTNARNEIKGSFQKLVELYLRIGSLSASCRYVSDHVSQDTLRTTQKLTINLAWPHIGS